MAGVVLAKGRDRRIKAGHLWVYQSEIASVDEGVSPGDVVEVRDFRRRLRSLSVAVQKWHKRHLKSYQSDATCRCDSVSCTEQANVGLCHEMLYRQAVDVRTNDAD